MLLTNSIELIIDNKYFLETFYNIKTLDDGINFINNNKELNNRTQLRIINMLIILNLKSILVENFILIIKDNINNSFNKNYTTDNIKKSIINLINNDNISNKFIKDSSPIALIIKELNKK